MKKVIVGDSYTNLRNSVNSQRERRSSGPAPQLYPSVQCNQNKQSNNSGKANN